jgi:DNA-binding response OmpR family regulator
MTMDTHEHCEATRRPRILVIEDEAGLLDILTVNLEAVGYEVIGAADGLAGLQAFDRELPDLVVLDINLPIISGFRLLELFRASARPATPVLALTALDFAEAEDLARRGLDAFLSKPFDPEAVLALVARLLGRPAGETPNAGGQ